MLQRLTTAVVLLCTLFISGVASAEQKKVFGEYEIHYSVLNSTFLTADVAKSYGITRGKNRAIVNIAVRKKLEDGGTRAQRARVSGTSFDLIHQEPLEFHEVDERDAIYYIAELRFDDRETVDFRIEVQADPNRGPFKLNFNKTLYVDK